MPRVVYLNGRFVPEREARISIYDSGVLAGDMAFEVTRTCQGRPFRLADHLARLFHSLSVLRIDPGLSAVELETITLETLARNRPTEPADVDWNIVHNVSRGPSALYPLAFSPEEFRPTVVVSCYPLARKMAAQAAAFETGIDLVVPAQRAIPAALFDPTIKSRSRAAFQLANFQAQDRLPGATPILVDPEGWLTESTSGNVFLVRRGELFTPEASQVLWGVTRGVILELSDRLGLRRHEAKLSLTDAAEADEMFVSSTSIGVLHARSFEGRTIGDGRIGPVTQRLRSALWGELGLDLGAQAKSYAERYGAASMPTPESGAP